MNELILVSAAFLTEKGKKSERLFLQSTAANDDSSPSSLPPPPPACHIPLLSSSAVHTPGGHAKGKSSESHPDRRLFSNGVFLHTDPGRQRTNSPYDKSFTLQSGDEEHRLEEGLRNHPSREGENDGAGSSHAGESLMEEGRRSSSLRDREMTESSSSSSFLFPKSFNPGQRKEVEDGGKNEEEEKGRETTSITEREKTEQTTGMEEKFLPPEEDHLARMPPHEITKVMKKEDRPADPKDRISPSLSMISSSSSSSSSCCESRNPPTLLIPSQPDHANHHPVSKSPHQLGFVSPQLLSSPHVPQQGGGTAPERGRASSFSIPSLSQTSQHNPSFHTSSFSRSLQQANESSSSLTSFYPPSSSSHPPALPSSSIGLHSLPKASSSSSSSSSGVLVTASVRTPSSSSTPSHRATPLPSTVLTTHPSPHTPPVPVNSQPPPTNPSSSSSSSQPTSSRLIPPNTSLPSAHLQGCPVPSSSSSSTISLCSPSLLLTTTHQHSYRRPSLPTILGSSSSLSQDRQEQHDNPKTDACQQPSSSFSKVPSESSSQQSLTSLSHGLSSRRRNSAGGVLVRASSGALHADTGRSSSGVYLSSFDQRDPLENSTPHTLDGKKMESFSSIFSIS